MTTLQLSPGDERYIYCKWLDVLTCEQATIALSNWTIPTELIKLDDGILLYNEASNTATITETEGNMTRIKLRGLENGKVYELKNTVTLDNGNIVNGFIYLECTKLAGSVDSTCPVVI